MPPAAASTRTRRHDAILRIVRSQRVRNQTALARELARQGLAANQATLSRDLRELGVVKAPDGYTLPEHGDVDALTRSCREWLRECTAVAHQVVLKTPPGGAQALAIALDDAAPAELIGTLAGDDTILAICRDARAATRLARALDRRRAR